MQQMFRYGITAVFLIGCSLYDVKTKKLPGKWFLFFIIAGIFVNIFFPQPLFMWIGGLFFGGMILSFGKLSEEQIGYGDGLTVIVSALFLRTGEVIGMFVTALFFCAGIAAVLFATGKIRRRMGLPFTPFLTAAFFICRTAAFLSDG